MARPAKLPEGVNAYRTIGPFDHGTLPSGLRRTHVLKEGNWGKILLEEGTLIFTWEDSAGGGEELELAAPAELIVPPQVQHRVEPVGHVRLTITFYRE